MAFAHKNLMYYTDFEKPLGIVESEYCVDSGSLPTKECEMDLRGERVEQGYFVLGTEPKNSCYIHKAVEIDSEGYIIEGMVPFWKKRRVSLLNYEREMQNGVTVLDEDYLILNRKKDK